MTPLIEASAAYPAFEHLALAAETDLLFALRIFDPETRLRSDEAKSRGLSAWGDLIANATTRGVDVRILLTDFEPIVANDMHRATWHAVDGFRNCVARSGDPERFQIIAGLHEGEFGKLARLVFWPLLRVKVGRIAGERDRSDRTDPGLWKLIRPSGRGIAAGITEPPRMWPATHHQKIAVADGTTGIVGGLDIDERRYDDRDHQRPADETWHDVGLQVEGNIAVDVRNHFVDCWNREVPRFNARLTQLGAPRDGLPDLVTALESASVDAGQPGEKSLQLIRTRSRRSRSRLALGPRPSIVELEATHTEQIRSARDVLYLETQFLRSPAIVSALQDAARESRQLHVVVLLPAAPDDVAFEGNTGADARHGEWLQVQALDRIEAAFGDRCGFFSLAKAKPGTDHGERAAVNGREIIYVHAKVAIADGHDAIVSSANLNGRSLRWDTEAGLRWRDASKVAEFQRDLWNAHLRNGFSGGAQSGCEALRMWSAAAQSDDQGPSAPQIVRYPLEDARRFAQRMPFVPANMV